MKVFFACLLKRSALWIVGFSFLTIFKSGIRIIGQKHINEASRDKFIVKPAFKNIL